MDAVQTTYNTAPDIGYPGQLVDIFNEAPVIETYWSEGGVYPGRGCIKGTATVITANKFNDRKIPYGVKTPASTGDTLVGIPVLVDKLSNDSNGLPWYADEMLVSVLKRGSMYAIAGEAVAADDPVYVVVTVGDSGLALGDLTKDDTPGTTGEAIALSNARWAAAAAVGKVGIVKISQDPQG